MEKQEHKNVNASKSSKKNKTKTSLNTSEHTVAKATNGSTITNENEKTDDEIKREKELRRLEWQKKLAEQGIKKEDSKGENLTKAQQKAKRREQQEAQRLLKAQQTEKIKEVDQENEEPAKVEKKALEKVVVEDRPAPKIVNKPEVKKPAVKLRELPLVRHLVKAPAPERICVTNENFHPRFIKLGTQYKLKIIVGMNSRCLALFSALLKLVKDLQVPDDQEFSRYLQSILQENIDFLEQYRPFGICMENAMRYFKIQISKIPVNSADKDKKVLLRKVIHNYIKVKLNIAYEAIHMNTDGKIADGDVILTYACSSLIFKILSDIYKNGKQFQVVIVDAGPHFEGTEMYRRLQSVGVPCKYCNITAVNYVMPQVTKVLLGSYGLLANSFTISRIGSAVVAAAARKNGKPVFACCETYKTTDKAQSNALAVNELDTVRKLSFVGKTLNVKSSRGVQIINLTYDITAENLGANIINESSTIDSKIKFRHKLDLMAF